MLLAVVNDCGAVAGVVEAAATPWSAAEGSGLSPLFEGLSDI